MAAINLTSIQVATEILVLARFEILDYCILMQGKTSKLTPTKSTPQRSVCWTCQREEFDLQIGSSVIACDTTKQWKVFSENGIWAEEASNSEEENNNNLDQYLNIDNLPEVTSFCNNVHASHSQSVNIVL